MLPAKGTSNRVVFPAVKSLPVRIYQPEKISSTARVIVSVHGISRQYHEHLEAYKSLADRLGYWLIVPEFDKKKFPRYQQLAKNERSLRADLALNSVLLVLKGLLNQPHMKIHLCGFSGGAQFSHRFAMLHPGQVASLSLCGAGWYTFPDKQIKFPYGLSKWPAWLGQCRVEEMAKLPLMVLVGENDTARDRSLRSSKELDAQQGSNRVERAIKWKNQMSEYAEKKHIKSLVNFQTLSQVGHDFSECAWESSMLQHIETFWHEVSGG